MRVFLMDKSSL